MPNFFEKFTGKTGNELFTDAVSAAKARTGASIAKKAASDPGVQEDIKEGVGQKLGVWIIDNWELLAGGVVIAIAAYFFLRRR